MKKPRQDVISPEETQGEDLAWQPSMVFLLVAGLFILAAVFALGVWLMPTSEQENHAQTKDHKPSLLGAVSANPFATIPASNSAQILDINQAVQNKEIPPEPEGDADPSRDLRSVVARGEKPTMPEVIERLHQAGVYSGLGAFSPPGTRPPLVGLAVPENFALPDGYVRHHQATDDGQRIEAILMYAPDREFFDGEKRPILVPKDRVVPPEQAPPGLPIRRIVIPAPLDSGKGGS